MIYEYSFKDNEELNKLKDMNKDKDIISIKYLFDGNYVTFSDSVYNTEIEILANKISILEQNNQELKEELTQIQTSIASLTSLIATTLEEK